MFGKPLGFDRMHEKKKFKEETNLICFLKNFDFFFKKVSEKAIYFLILGLYLTI